VSGEGREGRGQLTVSTREERFQRDFDLFMGIVPAALIGTVAAITTFVPANLHLLGLMLVLLLGSVTLGESALGPRGQRFNVAVLMAATGTGVATGGAPFLVPLLASIWGCSLWMRGYQLVRARRRELPFEVPLGVWVLGLGLPVTFFLAVPQVGFLALVLAGAAATAAYHAMEWNLFAFPQPGTRARLAIGVLMLGWGLTAGVMGLVDPRAQFVGQWTAALLHGLYQAGLAYHGLVQRSPPAAVIVAGVAVYLLSRAIPRRPTLEATPGGGMRWRARQVQPRRPGAPPVEPLAGPDEIRILEERSSASKPGVTRAGGETECPYCATVMARVDAVACIRCHTWHHRDCWSESGRCTTYGCGGVASEGV
jgi:hypothetical protein